MSGISSGMKGGAEIPKLSGQAVQHDGKWVS